MRNHRDISDARVGNAVGKHDAALSIEQHLFWWQLADNLAVIEEMGSKFYRVFLRFLKLGQD